MTEPSCPTCAHWQAEAKQAFAKRDRLEQTLMHVDGGAGLWRRAAKEAATRLRDVTERSKGLPGVKDVAGHHRDYANFVETTSQHDQSVATKVDAAKRRLWGVWSTLEPRHPLRDPLREIWGSL